MPTLSLSQKNVSNTSQLHMAPVVRMPGYLKASPLASAYSIRRPRLPALGGYNVLCTLYLHAYTGTVLERMRQAHRKDLTIPNIRRKRKTVVVQSTS